MSSGLTDAKVLAAAWGGLNKVHVIGAPGPAFPRKDVWWRGTVSIVNGHVLAEPRGRKGQLKSRNHSPHQTCTRPMHHAKGKRKR